MDIRAKICQICLVPAHGTEKYHQHYGGICCLSCKSFFRRSHRLDIAPHLFCENNGRCDVTLHNRTKCKKCRYARCLQAGLQEKRVLTESECVKYSQKKQCSGQNNLPIDGPPNNGNPNFESIFQELAFLHYNFEAPEWTKQHNKCFLYAIQILSKKFRDFAFKDKDFKSLCAEDQNLLLMRNSKLINLVYIAKYLAEKTGDDQLQALLGDDMPLALQGILI